MDLVHITWMGSYFCKHFVSLHEEILYYYYLVCFIDASAPSFQHFVQNQVWPSPVSPVQLVCRRIGDYTSMTCYGVEGLHNSDKLIIKETVQSFPLPHLLTTSLAVTLLVGTCLAFKLHARLDCIIIMIAGKCKVEGD